MICDDHPKYEGERRPTSRCETCWEIFNRRRYPNAKTIAEDIAQAAADALVRFWRLHDD